MTSSRRAALAALPVLENAHIHDTISTGGRIFMKEFRRRLEAAGMATKRSSKGGSSVAKMPDGTAVPFTDKKTKVVFPGDDDFVTRALRACQPALAAEGCPVPLIHDVSYSVSCRGARKASATWALNAEWLIPSLDGATIYRAFNRDTNRELISTQAAAQPQPPNVPPAAAATTVVDGGGGVGAPAAAEEEEEDDMAEIVAGAAPPPQQRVLHLPIGFLAPVANDSEEQQQQQLSFFSGDGASSYPVDMDVLDDPLLLSIVGSTHGGSAGSSGLLQLAEAQLPTLEDILNGW